MIKWWHRQVIHHSGGIRFSTKYIRCDRSINNSSTSLPSSPVNSVCILSLSLSLTLSPPSHPKLLDVWAYIFINFTEPKKSACLFGTVSMISYLKSTKRYHISSFLLFIFLSFFWKRNYVVSNGTRSNSPVLQAHSYNMFFV